MSPSNEVEGVIKRCPSQRDPGKYCHQNQQIHVATRLYPLGWVARRETTLQAAPDLCGKPPSVPLKTCNHFIPGWLQRGQLPQCFPKYVLDHGSWTLRRSQSMSGIKMGKKAAAISAYLDAIFKIESAGVTLSWRIEVRQGHCHCFSSPTRGSR